MVIVFCSLTGNVRSFVRKLKALDESIETMEVKNGKEVVGKKFILITYTINRGEMPSVLVDFLKNNASDCVGVIGSGNKNWGANFCMGAYIASSIVGKPVYHTFELRGTVRDVQTVFDTYKRLIE